MMLGVVVNRSRILLLFSVVIVSQMPGSVGATIPGDVNGDSVVNVGDVVLLKRYLQDTSITIDHQAADLAPFDSSANVARPDGELDAGDLVVLQARLQNGESSIAQAPRILSLDPVLPTGGNPQRISGTSDAPGAESVVVELIVTGADQVEWVQQVGLVDSDGQFEFDVFLDDGMNDVAVRLTNADGYSQRRDLDMPLGFTSTLTSRVLTSAHADVGAGEVLVLTRNGSGSEPYVLDDGVSSIIVSDGGRLVVMPGVTLDLPAVTKVQFDPAPSITVKSGSGLFVLGRPDLRATIRPRLPTTTQEPYWGGIKFQSVGASQRPADDRSIAVVRSAELVNAGVAIKIENDPADPHDIEIEIVDSYLGYRDPNWDGGQGNASPPRMRGIAINGSSEVQIVGVELRGRGYTATTDEVGVKIKGADEFPPYYLSIEDSTVRGFYDGVSIDSGFDFDSAGCGSIYPLEDCIVLLPDTDIRSNRRGIVASSGFGATGIAVQGSCLGFRLENDGAAVVTESNVVGNKLGIEVDDNLSGDGRTPAPVFNQNRIDNIGTPYLDMLLEGEELPNCSGFARTGNVYSELLRAPGSGLVLDFSENYWGVETLSEIEASLSRLGTNGLTADDYVPWDLSRYLAADGSTVLGGSFLVNLLLADVVTSGSVLPGGRVRPARFAGSAVLAGDEAQVSFTLLGDIPYFSGESLSVAIYREAAYEEIGSASLVRRIVLGDTTGDGAPNEDVQAGQYQVVWDGTDADGRIVESGAYSVGVEISASNGYASRLPTRSNTGGSIALLDLDPSSGSGGTDDRDTVQVFNGRPLEVPFGWADPTNVRQAARAYLFYQPGVAADCDFGSPQNPKAGPGEVPNDPDIVVLKDVLITSTGTQSIEIPWRDPSSPYELLIADKDPATNRPVEGSGEKFCVNFPSQARALFEPLILVERATPEIEGAVTKAGVVEAQKTRIRVEPYLVQRSYDQIAHFDFCLSHPSKVTFKILAAGVSTENPSDPATVKKVLADDMQFGASSCTGNDFHTLVWDDIDEPHDSFYTFEITADYNPLGSPPDWPELESTRTVYRGFLDLRP